MQDAECSINFKMSNRLHGFAGSVGTRRRSTKSGERIAGECRSLANESKRGRQIGRKNNSGSTGDFRDPLRFVRNDNRFSVFVNAITEKFFSDFERKVEESKDKARESLNMVPEIMNVINQAKERTEEAERALKGAEIDAEIARETAMEAQMKYAEEASKVATD